MLFMTSNEMKVNINLVMNKINDKKGQNDLIF